MGHAGEGQGRRRQALGEEGRGHGRRWPETEKAMVKFAGKKENGRGNNETIMDSCKRVYHGIENEEIYRLVVVVDAGTRRFCGKARRKFVGNLASSKLRHPI